MHKITWVTAVVLAVGVLGCGNNNTVTLKGLNGEKIDPHQADVANFTTIKWIDSVKNIGQVVHGTKIKIDFHFMNSGDKPLYITQVKPSCGCTLADYTKSAILPGQQGVVTAEYDSGHGMPQRLHKTVVVTANATNKPQTVLVFYGVVLPK